MPTMTQLLLLMIRFLGKLSLATGRRITGFLGWPMMHVMRRRRRIADHNLMLCFPELTEAARRSIRRQHFQQVAESLADFAHSWTQQGKLGSEYGAVKDSHRLADACRSGQGLILLTGHTTAMELGARLVAEAAAAQGLSITGIYRPLRNARLEAFQNQGRRLYSAGLLKRDDLRGMVRHLRRGGILWYAPDQDFGPERSVLAPFFGIDAATLKALPELARLGRAQVMGMYPIREATGRVMVHLDPVWQNFPSDDAFADLARFNAFLEHHIRRAPAQYWWMHRRFKSTPGVEYR
jgi:KDO2-lipid IV(A) lauroyltransferase